MIEDLLSLVEESRISGKVLEAVKTTSVGMIGLRCSSRKSQGKG
jgi:hypothetical protein